jgi:hypothetical protein
VQVQAKPVIEEPYVRCQQRVIQGPKLKQGKKEVVELGAGCGGGQKSAGIHLLQSLPQLAGMNDPMDAGFF